MSTTRGPLPSEFPPCVHRTQSMGFWDGEDEHGHRVGGYLRCYGCGLRSHLRPLDRGVDPEDCHACRKQPTQGTLDSLPQTVIEAAFAAYAVVRADGWSPGARHVDGPWASAMGAISQEVRERLEELIGQNAFPAEQREEYLAGAAITRGLILGWCLCEAVKAEGARIEETLQAEGAT